MSTLRSLKVLLIAYACRPGIGSEPEVGWQYAQALASLHEVWVVTRPDNAQALSAALAALPQPTNSRIHIVYHDIPRMLRFRKPGQRGYELLYYIWLLTAIPRIRRLHREVGFDIAHHLTVAKYSMFSPISFLEVPFIWGPVGGGESSPLRLLRTLSFKERLWEYVRVVVRWLGEVDPLTRRTARQAKVCLATTPETASRIKTLGGQDVRVFANVGLSEDTWLGVRLAREECRRWSSEAEFSQRNPEVVLLSVGRLLGWKGFHLGVLAFSKLAPLFPKLQYWLVGDGPYKIFLERLIARLDLRERILLLGHRKREEVLRLMSQADIFVFPSFHDSGGFVLLEAMASGLPIVCLDTGGPGQIVTPEVGIKVTPGGPEETIDRLAQAIRTLIDDPELRLRLSKGGQVVAEQYSYRKRAEIMLRLYEEVAGSE